MNKLKTHFNQKGSETVELALVMPIFIFFFFGIADFGFMIYDKTIITNASREAARSGIALAAPQRPTIDQITKIATDYCNNSHLINFSNTLITPVITITPNPQTSTNTTFGKPLTVFINYQYNHLILGKIIRLITFGTFPDKTFIQSKITMLYE
jgi:Flp pilus assembly protein TadG